MRQYLVLFFVPILFHLNAQSNLGYQKPNQAIQEIADAAPPPTLVMDSEGKTGILLYRYGYKTIDELSEPELKLAGLRINPKANIGSRQNYFYKATILDINSGKEHEIAGLPENAKLSAARWNNSEDKLAVLNTTENNVELWILDVKTKKVSLLIPNGINANIGNPFTWMKDDKSLLVQKLPENRKPLIDRTSQVPSGPTISESDGKEAQNRTYQDLLKNPTDEHNFEQLATSELHIVDLKGVAKMWMRADMYEDINLSPDGKLIMISKIEKPFSYIVPYNRFPSSTDIYDLDGKLVKNVYKKPLIEDIPKGFSATAQGPRNINWRRDRNADLAWVEALDGGDPSTKAEYRDALYCWE
ncbi:MAG TPA: S9 family peptidase, partial [Saprospiraceae bacterium]|nr:S9 family peptidase [Saprospiraceae bacterium]